MITKRQIVFSVLERLQIYSDDANITEEFVSSLIDSKRAMLIQQKLTKSIWRAPNEIKQRLCINLALTDKIEGYCGGGNILKSIDPLPTSIRVRGKEGPLLVSRIDGTSININIIPLERIPYISSNRFTSHLIYCAIDTDGRLIFISNDMKHKYLKFIRVTDIFETPSEAMMYDCDIDLDNNEIEDLKYPVEAAMVPSIIDLVVKDLSRTISIPEDRDNNATDDRRQ